MVVAQLVERSLPTPDVRSSNPVISKFNSLSTVLKLYRKDKNKEKIGLEWPILKNLIEREIDVQVERKIKRGE